MTEPKPFPKKQLFIAAGILFIVAIFMMNMGGNNKAPKRAQQPTPSVVAPKTTTTDDQTAIMIATQLAGLQSARPPGWEIKNTTVETEGKPSFTLSSQRQDQKILFVIWDNVSPADKLDLITTKVPFKDYGSFHNIKNIQVDQGQNLVSGAQFNWFVGRYPYKDKSQMCLVGAYRSPVPGKAVVVIGQPYSDNAKLDYQISLWLIDSMAAPNAAQNTNTSVAQPSEPVQSIVLGTPQELNVYQNKIRNLIRNSFTAPKGIGKKKTTVIFEIDNTGTISKITISEPSGDDSLDQALVDAITNSQPFPAPPHTKHDTLVMHATISGAGLTID